MMNVFKRLLLSFYAVVLCALVCASGVQAGSKIPLKGLFKVLKIDDIGFGHSLLHSGAIENMYQFGPGKAKSKDNGYKGKSEGDFVADLIRVLWFRGQADFQLNPTSQGAALGLDGEIFGQLMNHIYYGQISDNELIKGKKSLKGKILKKGFVNVWHARCKEIVKKISGVSACRLKAINALVDAICKSLDFCKKEERYKERTVQGILWAFFFHKLKNKNLDEKIKEINAAIGQIDEKYKDKSKALKECYCNKDLYDFEQKIKNLKKKFQLILMSKEYDVTLHCLLNNKGKYPSVVSQGNYPYEYEKGKFSISRPNCYEAALLDLFSILWHNPSKGCYDNLLLPEKLLDGKGFTRLRQALKNFSVAEDNKIRSEQYSYEINGKKYSSLARLYDILGDKKLEDQVKKLKIEDINTNYINRAEINQEWFNIVSNIKGVEYHSELEGKKIYEVNPGVKNFIKIFNYFYGTDAKSVDKLGGLISTDNRTITFKKTKEKNAPNEIEINVDDKENCFNFNMTVNIMAGHVELKVPRREIFCQKIIKKSVSRELLKVINLKNIEYINILTLLTRKSFLKKKIEWNASALHLIYYSFLLKNARVKLDVIKDILRRPINMYDQLKYLVYNLIESLPEDEHIGKWVSWFIFSSKKYNYDEKLRYLVENKNFIKKYGFFVLDKAVKRNDKELIKFLIGHKDTDVNRRNKKRKTLLREAIEKENKDIIKLLLIREDTDVNIVNNDALLKETALALAIDKGYIEIIKLLLAHTKMDVNKEFGTYKEIALALAIEKGDKEIIKLLLAHPKIDVNKKFRHRGITVLLRAIDEGDKEIVELLLDHKNIDACSGKVLLFAINTGIIRKSLNSKEISFYEEKENLNALALAIYNGDKKMIDKLLKEKDIDVNKGALNAAITKGNKEMINLLLEKKDIDINKGALTVAIAKGDNFVKDLLFKNDKIDVNSTGKYGETPLEMAVRKGDEETINKLFIFESLEINKRAPLVKAIEKGDKNIIKLFLEHEKIDINKEDFRYYKTPLFKAINKGDIEIVKLLLDSKDIDVNKKSGFFSNGDTLETAIDKGYKEIEILLLNHPSRIVCAENSDTSDDEFSSDDED